MNTKTKIKPKLHRVRVCEIGIKNNVSKYKMWYLNYNLNSSILRIKWRKIITDALIERQFLVYYILIDRVSWKTGKVWTVKQVLREIKNYKIVNEKV